jgi:O-antigen/teichoic acid export membrane protein
VVKPAGRTALSVIHSAAATGLPLKARMLHAAGWLVGGNVASQLLRLASNLILTRLLVPEAFGLVAAVNTLYVALVLFSDLGIWQSVVKSERGHHPRFLGTAWTVQLLRGALLCVVVVAIALALSVAAGAGAFTTGTVYADPRLPLMMAAFALSALLQGAESMKIATAQRELHGGHLARLELGSQLVATAVTLALAFATHSVWALLIGTLVASAARTAGSHFLLPGRAARPCWDRSCAREIVGFGKWIFLSSIIGFLAANGEKIILGASLATASFGIFAIASTLLAAVTGVYASLNGHVIFSSLSHALRKDHAETRRVYTRVQQLADLFLGSAAGLLLTTGQWVVWFLYDPRYHAAGWMLQWLGLSLLGMRHQVVEQLMFARGAPGWVSANNALRAIGLVLFIPAGFAMAGEQGAIAGVVLSQFASWPLSLWFKHRQGLLSWATEKWWLPALAAGVVLGLLLDRLLILWLPR